MKVTICHIVEDPFLCSKSLVASRKAPEDGRPKAVKHEAYGVHNESADLPKGMAGITMMASSIPSTTNW